MAETIVLDPAAVATSRTALDITQFISSEGVNWDDARIEQYLSDGNVGSSPVDYKIPNRQVVMPMRLMARGTFTFEQIRRQLQAKVALFQREGGWVSRVTTAGTHYADVQNASLRLGGDWLQASKSADVAAELSLELTPDWYGAEVTLDDQTETSLPAFAKVLKLGGTDAAISGDYPARVRVVVDEDDGDSQLGLLWGFRSRYYDSAATAALYYQAGSLTPLDVAGTASLASVGASGNVIRHASLAADWTPVLSTQMLSGTAHLTHRGTYRVWARCYSPITDEPPRVRLLWNVGDLVAAVENESVTLPGGGDALYLADLGEVRLDAAPVGTHRWQGMIQAKGATGSGSESVSIDSLFFQPVDDGAGRILAYGPSVSAAHGVTASSARDTFQHAAGTLTGKVLPVGGTWSGAGDTTDYNIDTAGHTVQRTAVSDTYPGRFALAGTASYTLTAVQTDVKWSAQPDTGGGFPHHYGVFARYTTGSSNHIIACIRPLPSDPVLDVIAISNAGAEQIYSTETLRSVTVDTWYSIRFLIDTAGRYWVWFWPRAGVPGEPVIIGYDALFASGGAQPTGQAGIFDLAASASAVTRSYDNFALWVPGSDAALNANQSAELRTDGMFREDSAGVAFRPTPHTGSLPRLPPSGLENRKVELFLKASRGDFDQLPDPGIDDLSARVTYRPSWLITPGS